MSEVLPLLARSCSHGVSFHTDSALKERSGIIVAFTERTGGTSAEPRDSLNLAGHVGDEPRAVDVNRDRLFAAVGIAHIRDRLVTAEQVHGESIAHATAADGGAGAFVSRGASPLSATDAVLTSTPELPLMLLFADCVPVILVAEEPAAAVAVVHAGWRGALASLPGKAARALATAGGVEPSALSAYIGPHIGACCYEVDSTLLSHFVNEFGTIAAVDGRLDLGACVRASLAAAGVRPECVASVNECTLDHVDRYFSYRASAITGRHGALAVITKVG